MPPVSDTLLTANFCRQTRLLFRPANADEAMFIQERLADFGIHWVNGDPVGTRVRECADCGMLVDKGNLYYNPQPGDDGILCTAAQFDKDYVPADQRLMVDLFNKLSAKVDALSEKIDLLYAEIHPEVSDTKPGLKKPQQQPVP